DPPKNDDTSAIEKVWSKCEQISHEVPHTDFDRRTAVFLRALFCDAKGHVCTNRSFCDARINANAIATGIVRNWISNDEDRRELSGEVAHGLLNEDGSCAASKELDEKIGEMLRDAIKAQSSPTGESPQN